MSTTFFFIRVNNRYEKIEISRIQFITCSGNYAKIHTVDKTYMTLYSLKQLEELLPPGDFVRIHRSYVVSVHCIQSFDKRYVYGPRLQLPIGETYADTLHRSVPIITAQPREPRRKRQLNTSLKT